VRVFLGAHQVSIDAKGRASIPAAFRAALKGDQPLIYVWPSHRGPFLEGGDQALLEKRQAALEGMDAFAAARADLEYAIFAEVRALAFDETGRVSLPEDLRAHAGLNGKAAFAGLADRFEIWAPEQLTARIEAARGRIGGGAP
jgi:MraZ protein